MPINLPLKQSFEESEVIETFLKCPDYDPTASKRIIEQSIVRTGSNRAYTYTHKT